jgi:hypothetical protein
MGLQNLPSILLLLITAIPHLATKQERQTHHIWPVVGIKLRIQYEIFLHALMSLCTTVCSHSSCKYKSPYATPLTMLNLCPQIRIVLGTSKRYFSKLPFFKSASVGPWGLLDANIIFSDPQIINSSSFF